LDEPRSYTIQISTVSNFSDNLEVNAGVFNDSVYYVDKLLPPNTFYYLRVGVSSGKTDTV
jgi:hypothetical protein